MPEPTAASRAERDPHLQLPGLGVTLNNDGRKTLLWWGDFELVDIIEALLPAMPEQFSPES